MSAHLPEGPGIPGGGRGGAISALIIEDRPTTRRALRRALENMFDDRAIVVESEGAIEAISILRSAPRFDLIISDYGLGATCGLQVLDFLRAEQPDMVDKFVFFTAAEGIDRIHHKVIDKADAAQFSQRLWAALGLDPGRTGESSDLAASIAHPEEARER